MNASSVGDFVSLPFMSRYAVQLAHLTIFSSADMSSGRSRLATPPDGGLGGAQADRASPAPAAAPVPRRARRLRPPDAETTAAASGERWRRERRGMGVISGGPPSAPSRSVVV